jgi:hypothetical protein
MRLRRLLSTAALIVGATAGLIIAVLLIIHTAPTSTTPIAAPARPSVWAGSLDGGFFDARPRAAHRRDEI